MSSSGSLTASGSGNGVYAYGSNSLFPTNTYQQVNFWVDVLFSPADGPNQPPVAVNDVGPAVIRDTPVTIAAASLLANDSDPNFDPLTITSVSAGGAHGTCGS